MTYKKTGALSFNLPQRCQQCVVFVATAFALLKMNPDDFQCFRHVAGFEFGLSELVHEFEAAVAANGIFAVS
jgi:hypothetical protein